MFLRNEGVKEGRREKRRKTRENGVKMNWIRNREHCTEIQEKHGEFFVLLFYGDFSSAAKRALSEIKEFCKEYEAVPVYAVDVEKVKGIHKEYNVSNVPTVIAVKRGKEVRRIEGVESAAFYAIQLGGAAPADLAKPAKKKALRVTVYTSPGCPPCGLVKNYLRNNGIPFRAVDISRDERAARDLVRRSGQQAVPQVDINGRLVVGFDRSKLAALLGIQTERRT